MRSEVIPGPRAFGHAARRLGLRLDDLAKVTGMAQLQGHATCVLIMVNVLLAARANGLVVLDGVSNAIDEISRV